MYQQFSANIDIIDQNGEKTVIDPLKRNTGFLREGDMEWGFTVPQEVEASSDRSLLLELTRSLFNELFFARFGSFLGFNIPVELCKIGKHPGFCQKKFGEKLNNYFFDKKINVAGYNISKFSEPNDISKFESVKNQFHQLFVLDQLLFNRDRVPHNLLGLIKDSKIIEIRPIDHEEVLACGARITNEWRTANEDWEKKLHPTPICYMIGDSKDNETFNILEQIGKEMRKKASSEWATKCADKLKEDLVEMIGPFIRPGVDRHISKTLKIYNTRLNCLGDLIDQFKRYAAYLVKSQVIP